MKNTKRPSAASSTHRRARPGHWRLTALLLTASCATGAPPRFSDGEVVWHDQDRAPVNAPEAYWSGQYWDAVDKTLFRPISQAFLFPVAGEAKNINALGEVPHSSWFENRIGLFALRPDQVARGPCDAIKLHTDQAWEVVSGKVNGANPGFVIRDTATDRRYLLKFDSQGAGERATSADVIGSKLYWAFGFSTPCNRIVYFDPKQIVLTESSKKRDELGRKAKMTPDDLARALAGAPRDAHGRIRGSASLFLEGRPLGPLTYDGLRKDDDNDVIPHEDRRELRGAKLLAAWLNHFDAREQNTFTTFIPTQPDGRGYVQHHLIDFGDCLGSAWAWDSMSRRFGHSYYFHVGHVLSDFLTLGLIQRPWDRATLYPEAPLFGYYDVANFAPEDWLVAYPNVVFEQLQLEDAYWAAKIISRISDAHLQAAIGEAKLSQPVHAAYLFAVLRGRRNRIIEHYFDRQSPLDYPWFRGDKLCAKDLGIAGGYRDPVDVFHKTQVGRSPHQVRMARSEDVCVSLRPIQGDETVVSLSSRRAERTSYAHPTRIYLRRSANGASSTAPKWRIVGIRRGAAP